MQKKIVLKIFQIVTIILLSVLLLFSLYQKYIKKSPLIKIGGLGIAIINSGSMQPTLNIGEMILIQEKKEYNVNDIVVFSETDFLVTHRIIEVNEKEISTKGDANNIKDEPISKQNIQGKVIYHSEILGWVLNYSIRPSILIIMIYIFFSSILNIKKVKSEVKLKVHK